MRETPVVSRHLHVPLQSGHTPFWGAMGRRYTIGQYRARLEGCDDFNLTTDVIVGFPAEDDRAFESTMAAIAEGALGDHEGSRLPVFAAAGHANRGRRTRSLSR